MKLIKAIPFCKVKVEDEIKNSYKAKNFIKKIRAYLHTNNRNLSFECQRLIWSEVGKRHRIKDVGSKFTYKELFKVTGRPFYTKNDEKKYLPKLELEFILYIPYDSSNNAISYYYLESTEILFYDVELLLKDRVSELKLKSYFKNEISINGEEMLALFMQVSRKNLPAKVLIKNDFDFYHDLARVNENIRYGLSFANIYSYYLTEFTSDPSRIGNKVIWRYFPTYNDRYYHYYLETVFTNYVTFWDRAAKLFISILKVNSKDRNNWYFSTLMERLSKDDRFSRLSEFKKIERFYVKFEVIKRKRNRIIHNVSLQSDFFHGYSNSNTSQEDLKKLDENLFKLYNDLYKFYKESYTAFYNYLKLIEKVNS